MTEVKLNFVKKIILLQKFINNAKAAIIPKANLIKSVNFNSISKMN